MTCIVAVKGLNSVVIGGDSAGIAGLSIQIRRDPKVFKVDDFAIGFTSSFRMGQLLMTSLKVAVQHDESDYTFMVTKFIDGVRNCFREGGYMKKIEEREDGGTFLVVYNGEIYHVDDDFQVGLLESPFMAVGCGDTYALGALMGEYQSVKGRKSIETNPMAMCGHALTVATKLSAGVCAPYNFISMPVNNEKTKKV